MIFDMKLCGKHILNNQLSKFAKTRGETANLPAFSKFAVKFGPYNGPANRLP